MARITNARRQEMLESINILDQFVNGISPGKPWESIIEFATSPEYCGANLYPRQQTILKLIYLETENLNGYDLAVIDKWRKGFKDKKTPMGVQPDIFERMEYLKSNGYTHFPKVLKVMGRRASKGWLSGIIATERMASLVALDDPQRYYGFDAGKPIQIQVMGTSISQAKRDLFNDISRTASGCAYLQPYVTKSTSSRMEISTPADIRRLTTLLESLETEVSGSSIIATPLSSTSTASRGAATFVAAFDEFAHLLAGTGGPRSSEEIWGATLPALDQFGLEGIILVPSSPYSKVGKFFDLYQEGSILMPEYLAKNGFSEPEIEAVRSISSDPGEVIDALSHGDPEMLILQLPSWEPYLDSDDMPKLVNRPAVKPIQYPPVANSPNGLRVIAEERRDPQKFKVEKRAQFAEVQDAYLDPILVDRMFNPFMGDRLAQKSSGLLSHRYFAHCDPGKTKANFAIAIGHLEPGPPDSSGKVWNHAVFDFTHVWQAEDFDAYVDDDGNVAKPTIDFAAVLDDIKSILRRFPSMVELTFDHWQSQAMIDELRRFCAKNNLDTQIKEIDFTEQFNRDLMKSFKLELEMDWVHAPRDKYFQGEKCLLELELKFLSRQGSRIDRQHFGPVTTKDLSDCVQVVSDKLLNEQLANHREEMLEGAIMQAGMKVDDSPISMVPVRRSGSRNRESLGLLDINSKQRELSDRLSSLSQMPYSFGSRPY